MAEALYETQPNRDMRFTPFRSETIGTYSYSLAQGAISEGIPTGVAWFDLAVNQLRADNAVSNNSISVFDRPGDTVTVGDDEYLVGPADLNHYRGSPRVNGVDPLAGPWHPSLVDDVDTLFQ